MQDPKARALLLTKRPKLYKPLKMPKYAQAVNHVCILKTPRVTSDQENLSVASLEFVSIIQY